MYVNYTYITLRVRTHTHVYVSNQKVIRTEQNWMTLHRCWTSPDVFARLIIFRGCAVGLVSTWHHFSPQGMATQRDWSEQCGTRLFSPVAFSTVEKEAFAVKNKYWILFCILLNCPRYQTPMCGLASAASKPSSKRRSGSVFSAFPPGDLCCS